MSVRTYVIEYVRADGTRSGGGVTGSGGNALLETGKHAHDGAEHTGLLPTTKLSTTETDVSLRLAPDGTGGVEWGSAGGSGALHTKTVISPAQLTANTDNWNPTGLATAEVIRVSTDASRDLTGIVAPAGPWSIALENIGAFDLVLKHNVTSTAANRFYCPNDADLTLQKDSTALLVYDLTSTRWRVVGGGGGGGGSVATDTIWDAAGDSVVGTGANTAARRKNNESASAAPTVNDDSSAGYAIGSRWLDTTNDREYVALDVTVGAAVWRETTPPGAGGTLLASITAASAAIANTETVVVAATLGAGSLAVGQSFRVRAAGVGTTAGTPGASTFRIRIGPTTLTGTIPTSVAPSAVASVTAQPFSFEAIVTIRTITASGTIIGECQVFGDDVATGLFTVLVDLSATVATVAVDSTVANLLELTFQSGAASSSCTFHIATIESLTASGGGGGGGSDLVQVASGAGSVRIPGILVPDRVPASPDSKDQEFDAALSGWSTLGTLDISEANVIPSNYHILKSATGAMTVSGIYRAFTPSYPFTVEWKLTDFLFNANYQMAGLMLLDATPTGFEIFALAHSTGNYDVIYQKWASNTSRTSYSDNLVFVRPLQYFRVVATSATSMALYVSANGLVWQTIATGINPGITVGHWGLGVSGNDNSVTAEAAFDWVRWS